MFHPSTEDQMSQSVTSTQRNMIQGLNNPKDDWQALIQHQAQITKMMLDKEKEFKHLQSQQMSEELSKIIHEKESQKQRDLDEQKRRDAEMVRKQREEYERELERKKQQKAMEQRALADSYQQQHLRIQEEQQRKREDERRHGEQLIQSSLDSLQQEKIARKRQLDDFKKSAHDLLREREMMRNMSSDRHKTEPTSTGLFPPGPSEQVRGTDLRNFYDKWSSNRNDLESIHMDRVLREKLEKDQKIEAFVQKGIREDQNRWQWEAEQQKRKQQEAKQQLINSLKSQIDSKERLKIEEKMSYPNKAENVVRESSDYKSYLDTINQRKHEQQKYYKQILDQQALEQEEKKRSATQMTESEKRLNQRDLARFRNAELQLDGLVPGVSNSQLNYLVSPVRAPHRDNGRRAEPGSNLLIAPVRTEDTTRKASDRFNSMDSGNQYPFARSPSMPSARHNEYNKVGQSLELPRAGGNRLIPQGLSINTGSYNPITNPIPNYNQNPYMGTPKSGQEQAAGQRKNILAMAADNNIFY